MSFYLRLVLAARSEKGLRETQHACLQHSAHVEVVVADVSVEEQCQEVVNRTVSSFGGVDVLILNAAYSPTPGWFADMEEPVSQWGRREDRGGEEREVRWFQSMRAVPQ